MLIKFLLSILMISNTFAFLVLDIELTHEKVLGKKTILRSELMSSEIVNSGKKVFLHMKNGIEVRLVAKYKEKSDVLTKDTIIIIRGEVVNISSLKNKPKLFSVNAKINIPTKVQFEAESGQRTIVVITPKIK